MNFAYGLTFFEVDNAKKRGFSAGGRVIFAGNCHIIKPPEAAAPIGSGTIRE